MTQRVYSIDGESSDRAQVRLLLGPGRLDELFSALLTHQPDGDSCPHCGSTEKSIGQTGLVGCPLCYAVHEGFILRSFGSNATAAS